jgi:anaerobic magnesium-protoporphyrin IX monomethyl ester cyclase
VPFDAGEADTALMNGWFANNSGLREGHRESVDECRAIVERLGDHHAAHLDLAAALHRERRFDEAERHVLRALELGHPLPGLAHNHLACIAKERGDLDAMMRHFTRAAELDPQHWVLIRNVNAARAWFKAGGPARGLPLELEVRNDFQLLERTVQPTLPGPLPDDWAAWGPAADRAEPAREFVKTPDVEGSGKALDPKLRLKVVSS